MRSSSRSIRDPMARNCLNGGNSAQSPKTSSRIELSKTSKEPIWWRIAAATGPRMPNVADSIATALKPKAKRMMFCRMIATVLRASPTRSGRTRSGSPSTIRSPASAARSAPMPPSAMPALAWPVPGHR